jgi:hypothetical protein
MSLRLSYVVVQPYRSASAVNGKQLFVTSTKMATLFDAQVA